jgi:uncharacterized protein (TIGR03437 family)
MQWRPVAGCAVFVALCAPLAVAQSAAFTVVNAASYGGSIAPDSLATIFGTNLSVSTASASLDSDGQLPTELAATRVEFNGVAAQLFYVSPVQINLVVPSGLVLGTANVAVRSTVSGLAKTGAALLGQTAPAVFTSDASGSGSGAILNAINYLPAPFLVLTDTGGSDVQTRLAIYGTGLRHAAAVTAVAQDSSGNAYTMNVEYAGAAPGFFGLDQVNVVLPPDVDGAGTVSLALSADGIYANQVTFQMNAIPAIKVLPALLTLDPNPVTAGDTTRLTVGLTGVARTTGYAVGLQTNNAAAPVVVQLVVPAGKASAQTTISPSAVTNTTEATIAATGSGITLTATLEIVPASTIQLSTLSFTPSSILGGRSLTGRVTLTGNAQAGIVNIAIASDNANVKLPGTSVQVPFGKSFVDFPIATLAVASLQTATLTATLNGATVSATLTLLPPLQLTLEASTVLGGNPVNGTVTLGDPAPVTGAAITLRASDSAVQVTGLTIPFGQSTQAITLTTAVVTAVHTVTISASYGVATQTAVLTVNPPGPVTLAGLSISPDQVTAGGTAQGTVTLNGVAGLGGFKVGLTVSPANSAGVPLLGLIVPQGQSSATFPITTSLPKVVTITATAGGVSKTATLTVQ